MPKLKYGKKKALLLEQKAQGKTCAEAIRHLKEQGIKVCTSYAYEKWNEEPQPQTDQATTTEPQPQTEEITTIEKPIQVPEELQSATQDSPILQDTLKKLDEGTFTKEDLKALFQTINDNIPRNYRPEDRTAGTLAAVWLKPLNKRMESVEDENMDIYIAGGVTALVYLPCIGKYIQDRKKKEEKQND